MASNDTSFLLTTLRDLLRWGRRHSFRPAAVTTACCATEYDAATASRFDMARLGAQLEASPAAQADVLLVLGTVTQKQAPLLVHLYEQMSEPKWVLAVGTCAATGGLYQNYHTLSGVEEILPVDLYVAGCPPRPENILQAIQQLQEQHRTHPGERQSGTESTLSLEESQ